MSIKVKATINAKIKVTKELEVVDRNDLLKKLEEQFNVDPASIAIMKPQLKVQYAHIKDQDQFVKNIKPGIQILFRANEKKELTEEQKQQIRKKQQQEAKIIEQKKKKVEESKIDAHKKILDILHAKNIKQRGFSFMNQNGEIENLHTDHYTSPVHLMRIVPEFKKFCSQYKVQPKNPDGLLIQQLGKAFKAIDGEADKMIDPLDWCSSFIAYCADDIDYPYPTYDFNYIITKILQTVQNAHITEAERKQPNCTPNLFGPGNSWFAFELNLRKTKITKLDDDDFEAGKQMNKKQIRYILECDLSDNTTTTVEDGIKKRFAEKTVWENFYAFDIEYREKIVNIQRPAKYLFIHMNRVGYPPSKDESEEIVLNSNAKSKQRIRTRMVLDLSELCSNSLKDRLENGKFERYQLFSRISEEEGYSKFIDEQRVSFKKLGVDFDTQVTDNEKKYMYFDSKLFEHDIFHQYYFEQLKGSKQTGQYRLVGIVFHKGDYFHHPDSSHKMDSFGHTKAQCRGEFMVMVYKQGKQWMKFYDAQVESVSVEQVLHQKYWGGGEWTPALCLYREIYIKNIQIEIPDDQ